MLIPEDFQRAARASDSCVAGEIPGRRKKRGSEFQSMMFRLQEDSQSVSVEPQERLQSLFHVLVRSAAARAGLLCAAPLQPRALGPVGQPVFGSSDKGVRKREAGETLEPLTRTCGQQS